MCLLVMAWQQHARFRLVVAANRDEFHARPATPLAPWPAPDRLLAGRDLEAGGTWLALDRERRFGIVTNFREMARRRRSAPSRGELVPRYIGSGLAPHEWLEALEVDAPGYAGFNLLLGDRDALYYASNRADTFARPLAPGTYGLANHFLDTPWPKLERVRRGLAAWLEGDSASFDALFALLADREPAPDGDLPETGLSPEWEKALSSPFVVNGQYGTRCTTVLALAYDGAAWIGERRFDATGEPTGTSQYRLAPGDWPA
jgi:uncharacterized protein with NRDE domain